MAGIKREGVSVKVLSPWADLMKPASRRAWPMAAAWIRVAAFGRRTYYIQSLFLNIEMTRK